MVNHKIHSLIILYFREQNQIHSICLFFSSPSTSTHQRSANLFSIYYPSIARYLQVNLHLLQPYELI